MVKEQKKKPWYFWVILVIAAFLLLKWCSNSGNQPHEYTSLDAVVFSETYFKEHYLKDPASYQRINHSTTKVSNNKFDCKVEYRAKNSFGGYITDTYEAIVTFDSVSGTVDYDFKKK